MIAQRSKTTEVQNLTKEDLYQMFPEFALIQDEALRENAALTMLDAIEAGGWTAKGGVRKCPVLVDPECEHLGQWLTFTRQVVGSALELYESMHKWVNEGVSCERDIVVAGALLHGIGKLTDYDLDENGMPCMSPSAEQYAAPYPGACFVDKHDLPEKIALIVANAGKLTPEAVFIRQAESLSLCVLDTVMKIREITP